jgi:hypothetical protein
MEKKSLSDFGIKPIQVGFITFLFAIAILQSFHIHLNMKYVTLIAPILAYFWVYQPILICYKERKFTIVRGW